MLDVGPDHGDPIAVRRRKLHCVRVIQPDSHIPAPAALAGVELDQKPCRIVGVHGWIEGLLQRSKRIWMILQVNLHAANINEAVTRELSFYPGYGCWFAVEEQPRAVRVYCPRPCTHIEEGHDRAATFGLGDGPQKAMRQMVLLFG